MTSLERSWLFIFANQFNDIKLKTEQHLAYREELKAEMMRIDEEIFYLDNQKENLLSRFAESFLRISDEQKQKAERQEARYKMEKS